MSAGKFALKVAGDAGRFAAIALAALGDRLGLFAALRGSPATSEELAQRAGLQERYVREWLLAMRRAGDVELSEGRYALPPERAEVLANEGGPFSLTGTFEMLLGMVDALGPLEKAFREGGGVPAAAYPASAWRGMERDMAGLYAARLASEWIPALPEVQALLQQGCDAADVGCGRGRALIELEKAFPRSRYCGFDLFAPNSEAARRNAPAIEFAQADATQGLPRKFDVIFAFDVLHDAPEPVALLRGIRSALKPGGRLLTLDPRSAERAEDNDDPLTLIRYGFSVLYCLPASQGRGLGT